MNPLDERAADFARLTETHWDVLIIGGGASGLGSALEAALRGLKVALVEADDYAAHTSSASTKLVHGGVRYLEKAFKEFDYGQYKLVREALHERARLLANAPHLCHPLPTLLPVYSAWQKFYFGMGLKVYDLVASDKTVPKALAVNRLEAQKAFPLLSNSSGREALHGGLIYYDGQFDDARLAVSLARSARKAGATVLNHARLLDFAQHRLGGLMGAAIRDELTGQMHTVQAHCFLNCTGATADRIRQMARPSAQPRLRPSRGIHIVLPREALPGDKGLIVPSQDGRVIFVLPWFHCLLVGTTDVEASADAPVMPTHEEVQFLLDETARYLNKPFSISDIRGVFAGNRPLVSTGFTRKGKATEGLIRNHEVEVFKNERLINVLGGKWTTYRQMGEEAIDAVQLNLGNRPPKSPTPHHRLVGAEGSAPQPAAHWPADLQAHLRTYGTELPEMEVLLQQYGAEPLAAGFPYTQADVRFAIRHSQAFTVEDILARRIRLEIEDLRAARAAAPAVAKLLADAYEWPTDFMLDQIAGYQAKVDGLLAFIQAK